MTEELELPEGTWYVRDGISHMYEIWTVTDEGNRRMALVHNRDVAERIIERMNSHLTVTCKYE